MLLRVLTLLALTLSQSHADEEEKQKIIYPDAKSTATILSMSNRPPSLKVRFKNNNSHPVIVFTHEGVVERKTRRGWETLWTGFQDNFGAKDIKRVSAPSPTVNPDETLVLEFTPTHIYKDWKKGDVLRFSFVHQQRTEDFPNRGRVERMRAVVTESYKSEQGGGHKR